MNNKLNKSHPGIKDLKKPHYYGVRNGVHIFHGSHDDHKKHIGKHLENPSDEDLSSAIDEAKDKGLHHLYIHGSPPKSLRAKIHPELGEHIPGELGKIEVVESWGEDEEDEEEMDENTGLVKSSGKAIENRKPFNPSEHHGKKVKVHWNLNRDCWTVKDHDTNKLLGHAEKIALENPSYEVSEAGRQDVIRKQSKGVHAHVVGSIDANHTNFDEEENSKTRTAVTYNPFKYDSFVQRQDPTKAVHQSEHVVMTGTPGGINKRGKPCNIPRVHAKGPSDIMTEKARLSKERYAKKMASKQEAEVSSPPQEAMAKGEKDIHPSLAELHNIVKEHAKQAGITIHESYFRSKKTKKAPSSSSQPQKKQAKQPEMAKSELKQKVQQVLKKIEHDIVTLTTRELTKGLVYPDSKCDACGCRVEGCLCFEGFSEPEFEFDGKNLKILFKSDWDEASKESYIDDFKKRAGRLIKRND